MQDVNTHLTHAPNIVKGSLFALFAFFMMAVFGILTKLAVGSGDYIWVSFITYLVATVYTTLLIFSQGIEGLKSQHYYLLIARAVIGTLASFLYMLSMHYIPVVNSTLLFNTAPIFIPLLMAFYLKVHVEKNIWIAVILGFIGIIIIIKPDRSILTDPGNLIGLASGLALAIAYLTMKILTNTETGLRIIFYYVSVGTLMQVPILFFASHIPSGIIFFYGCLCGIALVLAQIGLVKAYNYASASQVGVYQYTSVVIVALFEWLLWSQPPNFMDFFGFLFVCAAGIYIIKTNNPATKAT